MLTLSSSPLTSSMRQTVLFRRYESSSNSPTDLYRPRTILIEKPSSSLSYGFSIQTYGFASLNPLSNDESGCSFLSLSTESTASHKSTGSTSFLSHAPIQLVTYVDHVHDKSPAWEAGLRSGSVILSVNDQTVEHDDHETLVKRITETTTTPLKLLVVQQNVNKQIALCEQLYKLHKLLNEKEEELEELCRQERDSQQIPEGKVSNTPSPCLEQDTINDSELSTSVFHNRIPLDWRQSVTNFACQQKLTRRTLPIVSNSLSSIVSSKSTKTRSTQRIERSQRSLSLSSLVFQYSKSAALCQTRSSVDHAEKLDRRRAMSSEDLMNRKDLKINLPLNKDSIDQSMITSGCSLAIDLSRSFDLHHYSSSSSSTIDSDDENPPTTERISNKIQQLKWKLRINH